MQIHINADNDGYAWTIIMMVVIILIP